MNSKPKLHKDAVKEGVIDYYQKLQKLDKCTLVNKTVPSCLVDGYKFHFNKVKDQAALLKNLKKMHFEYCRMID